MVCIGKASFHPKSNTNCFCLFGLKRYTGLSTTFEVDGHPRVAILKATVYKKLKDFFLYWAVWILVVIPAGALMGIKLMKNLMFTVFYWCFTLFTFQEPENVLSESTCLKSFLQWQNVDSLCWLDSLLSCVVHNVTLTTYVKILPQNVNSVLRTLIESFNKAQELSLTDREQSEQKLHYIREEVWNYLKPKMKCQRGVNDSPVTALPLLLRENGTVSEEMLQVYQWEFSCTTCGYQQVNK